MKDKDKKEEKIEKYSAKVYCKNCNQGGMKISNDGEYFSDDYVIDIPKGTLLKDAKCINCGCPRLALVAE